MQAPAPIVILEGPDLVFQLVNPAYQRIFPGRELAGKPLLAALPGLVGTPIPDLFYGVYQTGKPVTMHELPLLMARHQSYAPMVSQSTTGALCRSAEIAAQG
ncbi:MAG: PAS domain-containing protein [Janthinobacterium lividum]